ncbi:MAG: hypothetical protein ACYDBA_14100, partial [Sulfuricaulis sp.]
CFWAILNYLLHVEGYKFGLSTITIRRKLHICTLDEARNISSNPEAPPDSPAVLDYRNSRLIGSCYEPCS